MLSLLLLIFIAISSFLILICAIAFVRAKDVFTMTHIVTIFNSYILPIALIAGEIKSFSISSILKILTLSLLNLIIVNVVCHLIVRRAMINKIHPDAEEKFKK